MHRAISTPRIGRDPPTQADLSDQAISWFGAHEPASMEPTLAGNRLIRRLLACLLDQAPRAAMASLCIPGACESDEARSFYRVTRVTPGKRSDSLEPGVPALPDWQALLPWLQAGQGIVLPLADLLPGPSHDRLSSTSASYVLACPATGPAGDPAAVVFIVFGISDDAPRGAELRRLKAGCARIASQIAAVLDLVDRAGASPACAEAAQDGVGPSGRGQLRA